MINPLIGCVIPVALALLLLSAVSLAGKRFEEHRAYVRKLRVATSTFVLQRFGKSCVMKRLSFATPITADAVFGGKELVNTREHLKHLIETMHTAVGPVWERAATAAERCSARLTRYAT